MANPNERGKDLSIIVDRATITKILSTGHAFDINKGGLYDARSGVVNFWCKPDDKPTCWDKEILPGDLGHPCEYVGKLYWDWQDDERAKLRLDCTPYQLLDARRKERKPRYGQPILTEDEWTSLMTWLEQKTAELLRLVDLHPTITGTRCPFCDFVLPIGEFLNALVEHVDSTHREVKVTGIALGNPAVLITSAGDKPLQDAESFT